MNKIQVNKPGNSSLVMIFVPTGAYYEDDNVKGISHFLEHMMFKGTATRTCQDIACGIEKYGGDLNAYTDWEITAYHAEIGNSYLSKAIEIIEDMISNPKLDQKEIDKERQVILQEYKMCQDNSSDKCFDMFHDTFYKKDHGLSGTILGTPKTLKTIDCEKMKEYYKQHYSNPTMILVGNVKDSCQISSPISFGFVRAKNSIGQDKIITRSDIQQSRILIGNSISDFNVSYKELLPFTLELISAVYNDMGGRLFRIIREEHNLVYGVRFNSETYTGGLTHWFVNLGLDKKNITKARDLIVKELTRSFTQQEIEDAITKAIGETEMLLDSNSEIADLVAYQLRKGLDYNKDIKYYKNCYNQASLYMNDLIGQMNFKDNVLLGVTPGKQLR